MELSASFEATGPLRWVSGEKAPIREIFEFQLLKGRQYSARWGFSLDFVPGFRNGTFRSKRTSKAAEFDLCIDPIDEAGAPPAWGSFADEEAAMHVAAVVAKAARMAKRDFDRVRSLAELIEIFRERRSIPLRRFSLDNYVQTHLAWGLASVATGRRASAETHLGLFCSEHGVARDDRALRKAEAEAAAFSAPPFPVSGARSSL